ncbi:MAG: DUF1365 domain-containing protein [Comamonadaceae bacterium]|nr:DUF1365 domain-containing protein [Comamonadaceae bacterium]
MRQLPLRRPGPATGRICPRRQRSSATSLFMLYLDLGGARHAFSTAAGSGRLERPALAWLPPRRTTSATPASRWISAVRDRGRSSEPGRRPPGPIRLLTHLRYFGYCFNPISVYYCFDARRRGARDASSPRSHNTPWGESTSATCSTWPVRRGWQPRTGFAQGVPRLAVHADGYRLRLALHARRGRSGGAHGRATRGRCRSSTPRLGLRRASRSTGRSLAGVLARWPFMTVKVIAAIYWQALRLKLKGVPFCPHPANSR